MEVFQDKCLLIRFFSIIANYLFLKMSFVVMLRKVKLAEPDLVQVFAVAGCLLPLLRVSYFSPASLS